MKQKILILFFTFCISFVSCDDRDSLLPESYVYLELDLTYRDKALREQLGYKMYINQGADFIAGKEYVGYGGVLVVHTITDGLHAFDLACPNEVSKNIKVEITDNTGLNATCPKCGTIYEVGDPGSGVAINADKKLYLTTYHVTSRGNNKYIVSNY
ncbi:MAG: (2Fe-2S)-binding protein [Tannerella sp.]|jgi:nitrite reductase/ring-hydroxylating ferredoxin subunit|nr:(2Fe-2S)-binding protein [Tannerella sp.]